MIDSHPPPRITLLLEEARTRIRRLTPTQVHDALGSGALVVDTRPAHARREHGHIPGAIVIERNILEWRLDPTGPWAIPEMTDPARPVVVFCRQGYASSIAAASLAALGLTNVADMIGGIEAWVAEGRPVIDEPTHERR